MEWIVINEIGYEQTFQLTADESPFPWGTGLAIMNNSIGGPSAYWNTGDVREIRRASMSNGGAFHYELKRLNDTTLDIFTEEACGLQPISMGLGNSKPQYGVKYLTLTQPGPPGSKVRDVLLLVRLDSIKYLRLI